MHRVFISYHHGNDRVYKEELLRLNRISTAFVDASVDTGDIADNLGDDAIRKKIRDDYLRDSTVTLVLVGTETRRRKHVDWEIFSSMYDGTVNKRSGILVVNLPTTLCDYFDVRHTNEKEFVYSPATLLTTISSRTEYDRRYPFMPERIIDNLLAPKAMISVVNWNVAVNNWNAMKFLVNATFEDRILCDYDLSRPMRRSDS